jgi:hypothetical protein
MACVSEWGRTLLHVTSGHVVVILGLQVGNPRARSNLWIELVLPGDPVTEPPNLSTDITWLDLMGYALSVGQLQGPRRWSLIGRFRIRFSVDLVVGSHRKKVGYEWFARTRAYRACG